MTRAYLNNFAHERKPGHFEAVCLKLPGTGIDACGEITYRESKRFPAATTDLSVEKFYYDSSDVPPGEFEAHLNVDYEQPGKEALDLLRQGKDLGIPGRLALAEFVGLHVVRGRTFRRQLDEKLSAMGCDLIEQQLQDAHIKRIDRLVRQLRLLLAFRPYRLVEADGPIGTCDNPVLGAGGFDEHRMLRTPARISHPETAPMETGVTVGAAPRLIMPVDRRHYLDIGRLEFAFEPVIASALLLHKSAGGAEAERQIVEFWLKRYLEPDPDGSYRPEPIKSEVVNLCLALSAEQDIYCHADDEEVIRENVRFEQHQMCQDAVSLIEELGVNR